MGKSESIYRVIFNQEGKQYEIYARYISEDTLMGFIEVEELVFSKELSVVVDPNEEKLRNEFKGVQRFYVPMHAIMRIDEVAKEGQAVIRDSNDKQGNVSHFPHSHTKLPTDNNS